MILWRFVANNKPSPSISIIVCAPSHPKRSWNKAIIARIARANSRPPKNCKYGSYRRFWLFIWNALITWTTNGWNRRRSWIFRSIISIQHRIWRRFHKKRFCVIENCSRVMQHLELAATQQHLIERQPFSLTWKSINSIERARWRM